MEINHNTGTDTVMPRELSTVRVFHNPGANNEALLAVLAVRKKHTCEHKHDTPGVQHVQRQTPRRTHVTHVNSWGLLGDLPNAPIVLNHHSD